MRQNDIITELRRAVDEQAKRPHRYRRVAVVYVLLVAAVILAAFRLPALGVIATTMLLSLPIVAVVLLLALMSATDDYDAANYRLAAAEQERESIAAALELAASGAPFALFLRSFDAERQGMSASGVRVGNITRTLGSLRNARHGMIGLDDDIGHLEANWRWERQLAVLSALKARAPTILLGNTRLSQDMRGELAHTGATELTIQIGDWWHAFLALADRARIIVLYIEQATPMLVREIGHIRDHGSPYIVMGEADELEKLGAIPEIGAAFLGGAALICGTRDVALLAPVLDRTLSAQ